MFYFCFFFRCAGVLDVVVVVGTLLNIENEIVKKSNADEEKKKKKKHEKGGTRRMSCKELTEKWSLKEMKCSEAKGQMGNPKKRREME